MTLERLFPDEDYRFFLRFERVPPAGFFLPTAANASLLAERRHWLEADPKRYSVLLPEGVRLLEQTIQLAREWNSVSAVVGSCSDKLDSARAACLELGAAWEPDFLLLDKAREGVLRLVAACVCFPSSWSLEEKIGKPIEEIHGVVPGLNPSIGPQIHVFLSKLRPGMAWLRSNWGLSRSSELNQHPARNLPRLNGTEEKGEIWLRVEHQALVALPRAQGILFGIRIALHPFEEISARPRVAEKLSRALRTMPAEVARYKGLESARERLLELLAT